MVRPLDGRRGKLLVHSIYRGIYTHNTLERGLKDAQSNLKVRTGNVSGDIWQQFDWVTNRLSVKIQVSKFESAFVLFPHTRRQHCPSWTLPRNILNLPDVNLNNFTWSEQLCESTELVIWIAEIPVHLWSSAENKTCQHFSSKQRVSRT